MSIPSIPDWALAAREQWRWRGTGRPPFAVRPAPGQLSVWDFPRPPRLDSDDREVVIRWGDLEVARTRRAVRVLETAHPPSFYLPWADVARELLQPAPGGSYCEWKGPARYWTLVNGARRLPNVAWSYPAPLAGAEALADCVAFYPAALDCRVDAAVVRPQPGGFYGGWITPELVGPFKGEPGERRVVTLLLPAAARRVGGGQCPVIRMPWPSAVLLAILLAIVLASGGCATRPASVTRPAPSVDSTRPASPADAVPVQAVPGGALGRLAAGRPGPLAVGGVQAGDADAAIGRFAAALHAALAADLRAIGVPDKGAATRLDAVVARRDGAAEAQVIVTRGGQTRLKKRYRVELPAVAADEAAAVRTLLGDIYDDPEFDLAVKD